MVCVCVFVREFSEPREEAPQITSQGLKAAVCLPVCREREGGGRREPLEREVEGQCEKKKRKQEALSKHSRKKKESRGR